MGVETSTSWQYFLSISPRVQVGVVVRRVWMSLRERVEKREGQLDDDDERTKCTQDTKYLPSSANCVLASYRAVLLFC